MKNGEFLKEKRLEKKLSLRQLAYKTGLSHTYISDIEKGNLIGTTETHEKIMNALNFTSNERETFYNLLLENETLPKYVYEKFKNSQDEIEMLKTENIKLKQQITVSNNNNVGNISVGNVNISTNGNNSAISLEGLSPEQIEEVKKYIEFLKVQNKIKGK